MPSAWACSRHVPTTVEGAARLDFVSIWIRAAFQAFELLLDRMKDNLLRAGDYKSSCVATINVNGLANTSLAIPAIIDSQPYAAAFFFQEVGGSDFETANSKQMLMVLAIN